VFFGVQRFGVFWSPTLWRFLESNASALAMESNASALAFFGVQRFGNGVQRFSFGNGVQRFSFGVFLLLN
jgi:tRNA(Glu) U13 pseudouridine synthase TruD